MKIRSFIDESTRGSITSLSHFIGERTDGVLATVTAFVTPSEISFSNFEVISNVMCLVS